METEYFHHPRRFPKNADGPFYTTGYQARDTDSLDDAPVWCGDCLECEAPEAEAPELLAPLDDKNHDTYFVRQPVTSTEIANACSAAQVCCVSALRYAGRDQSIINQLQNNPEFCDHVIDNDDQLVIAVDSNGELLPFAQRIANTHRAEYLQGAYQQRAFKKHKKPWWKFWL